MSRYSLRHLSDDSLSVALDTLAADDRLANATLLAHIAEFDRRGLCRPTQYPSMYRYCVGHLRMSEDVAYKRVRVARVARSFPGVFDAVADGRLNLSGVTLLARYLTRENGRELLKAAVNRSNAEIRELIARRFPVTGASVSPAEAATETSPLANPSAEPLAATREENMQEPQQFAQAARPVGFAGVFGAPAPNSLPELQLRVTPIAPGRYEVVAVIDQETHDQLLASKDLLGHVIPSGALVEVVQRAIALQHQHLLKRRSRATDKPRANGATPPPNADPRQIAAEVERAVWQRDGSQCAYISADGHRCEQSFKLELDHIVPVARGGQSTVENLRLLCETHHRLVTEREFGKEHVKAKREEAQRRREATRFHKQAERERLEKRKAEIERQREELGVALKNLGYSGRDLEIALAYCASRAEAPLDERLKYALSCMAPRARKESPPPASAA